MFRWYRNSEKCYVYLADVHSPEYNVDGHMFHQSRWFTRGWTLQELLAPTCVEFFTKDFQYIGSRNSLSASIIQATGIPEEALHGYPLYKFTVAQRLKWAKHRSTKREEDTAYSLLGIFDVYMPLIYGEGKERAMSRLMHASDEHERRQHGYLFKWLRLMFPRVMVKYNAYESFVFWMVFGSILGVTIAYHGIADWFTAYTAKGARFAVRDMKIYPGLGLLSVASLSYLFRYH
ncbi:hypothetical protein SLS60_007344 [Paraconiothyrium brasiliense]|uniref:Uncharacterized protein n=1 Tax=Paraconiothyrium brasiliense TaxID=300254 RepID=A0ABR3R550_9PLEO